MNRTDPNEGWNDENNFLSGALHGAADEMPGGEVDDLHISFGVVRDRVRRRRAAKISGVTGASLVVVGVLALGATQISLGDRNSALPGMASDSAAPEAFATPAPGVEPSPSGPPASTVIQDDYQPAWLDWSDLTCGMPVADLETTAAGWSVASAGDIYADVADFAGDPSTAWGMAVSIQGTDGVGLPDAPPTLVWSQDGVVVDLGLNVFDGAGQSEPLLGSGGGAVEAQDGTFTSCAPIESEVGDLFGTPLPEGDYEVRVVAFPEVAVGQWATAVSEPVAVRLDAAGAHSPTLMRGGPATIEPLAPDEFEQTRFVLDRSTDWVVAEQTQSDYSSTDPVQVTAQCESVSTGDTVPYEVVVPSTQAVLGSGVISCDQTPRFNVLGVLDGGEEVLDIRLGAVPDGVARLEAVLAPEAGMGGEECSATDVAMEYDPASSPNETAGATAQAIVEAAQACDSEGLIALATQYPTELLIPAEPAEQVFALPEGDAEHYRTLVALLAGTVGADQGEGTFVWPRVVTDEFSDSDEAWDEVVAAGLLTQEQADAQRADETFGYQGMRIGIDSSGNWRYYSAAP